MRRLTCTTALLALLPSASAVAHPHIFVGVEVTVIFGQTPVPMVQLAWVYDDYFSLLITSDLGIDLDGDLLLTEDEKAALNAAITEWPPNFKGDLEVMQAETVLGLAPKAAHQMTYEGGIVRETHVRPLAGLADPNAPLVIRAYDPFYYVAYELAGPVRIVGRDDCDISVIPPDLDAAYSLVEELLYGRPAGDVGPDEEFPEVGIEFAETITVTCAAPL